MYQKLTDYEVIKQRSNICQVMAESFHLDKDKKWSYCNKNFKAPNVYYDYPTKKIYHVYCKPFAPELENR